MRKIKLDVDALHVESFEVDSHAARDGTVHAQFDPEYDDAGSTACDGGSLASWWYGTCGTCVGPTYCCPPTWRPTCPETCLSCPYYACTAGM